MTEERLLERFLTKVDKGGPGECWLWTAHLARDGYGRIRVGSAKDGTRTMALAHRVAYELFVGPIPPKHTIDHLCRVTRCVNPAHLEAVSQRENTLRGISPTARAVRENRCGRGHPFDAANTYFDSKGHRSCRACRAQASRALRERRKDAA